MNLSNKAKTTIPFEMQTEVRTGFHYEDFEIGKAIKTAGRTITETDIVNFSGLSGDFNPIHTDEVFAKSAGLGGRIAHGPMIIGMALGLGARAGLFDGTVLGLLSVKWDFFSVVRPGDTLHVIVVPTGKRVTRKADRGIVDLELRIMNQSDVNVQTGQCKILFLRRN